MAQLGAVNVNADGVGISAQHPLHLILEKSVAEIQHREGSVLNENGKMSDVEVESFALDFSPVISTSRCP